MKTFAIRYSRFLAVGIVLWVVLPNPHQRHARAVVSRISRPLDERVTLAVWFVGKDRPDAEMTARAISTALANGESPKPMDRAPIPDQTTWSELSLANAAGADVARAAMTTEIDRPSAPVPSAWGFWIVVPRTRRLG